MVLLKVALLTFPAPPRKQPMVKESENLQGISHDYFNPGTLLTLRAQPLLPSGRHDNRIYYTQSLLPGMEQTKRKSGSKRL